MKRLIAISAALALTGSGMAVAGFTATPTELTIKTGDQGGEFIGRVKSPSENCEPNRVVRVFRKMPGKDERIGKDVSNGVGRWRVRDLDQLSGTWYAKTRQVEIGQSLICARDRSPTVSAG